MAQRKKKVAVFTKDKYLFQKIKLELYHCADTLLCEKAEDAADADTVLTDADTSMLSEILGIKMTRHGAGDGEISIPFPLGRIEALVNGTENRDALSVSEKERCAILHGRKIKLTEVEFSLLDILLKSGDYVSREELLRKIWKNNADGGVINVYVHYLREKLETDGEKIIISSRKQGYKISEKFTGGRDA